MEPREFFNDSDELTTCATPAEEQPKELVADESINVFRTYGENGEDGLSTVEPEPVPAPTGPVIPPSQAMTVDTDVDLVFVIDATGSMTHFCNKVKEATVVFKDRLEYKYNRNYRKIRNARARVIAFRDYYYDEEPMRASRFFNLNNDADKQAFVDFVNAIEPVGGGDEPESALEALYEAFHSPWSTEPSRKRRQIIVLVTDASAHSLEDSKRYDNNSENHLTPYPTQMATTLEELAGCWMNDQVIKQNAKRLLLCTPFNSYPWTDNTVFWDCANWAPLNDMCSDDEEKMDYILRFITSAI